MFKVPLNDWKKSVHLIQSPTDLPNWKNTKNLYLDFETTSGDDALTSLSPWRNCKILGVAVLVDDVEDPIYIPLRHRSKSTFENCDPAWVMPWLELVVNSSGQWINHNIKYDAHVLTNSGVNIKTKLIDTLMMCKLAPFREEFKYNLTDILSKWCHVEIQRYEDIIKLYLKDAKSKDYAVVPIDKMAPYAAVDVLSVRHLYKYLMKEIPEDCKRLLELEQDVTRILFDIECNGMKVDQELLELHEATMPIKMELLQIAVTRESKCPGFQLHTNDFGKRFFINMHGLEIIKKTEEKGTPSFDSDTLLLYKAMRPDLGTIIDKLIEYKEMKKLYTSFTLPYLELNVDGIIHPDYNQIVSTGRMSCRTPNMQQLSPEAKEYIIPFDIGSAIVDIDFCVTGDTLIITPYGNKPMSEVCEKLLPVLGLTNDCELVFCNIEKAAKVGIAPCYRITFEDGSTIECTGEHGFEDFKERKRIDCKDIKPGMRLAHVKEDIDAFGYPRWYIFSNRNYYKKHKLVGDFLLEDKETRPIYHYHHINGDKECWTIDNIQLMLASLHISKHSKENYQKQDHTLRVEKLREGIKRRVRYVGANNPNYRGAGQKRICETCGNEFIAYPSQETRGIKKYCCAKCRSNRTGSNSNHRVAKVEYIGEKEVYTLTNPITHNYVSANGLVNLNSQIEFRLIAHFIKAENVIREYAANPAADYHDIVAKMCGIDRKPAKTMNFMLGYGGGRGKCVKVLSSIPSVIGELKDEDAIVARANEVYDTYHRMLPTLKQTQYTASRVIAQRGYVRTLLGRRRYLHPKLQFKAFNTVSQGSAADIFKAALRRVYIYLQEVPEIKLIGCVHDSFVFSMPKALVEREVPKLIDIISLIPEGVMLRVPMRAEAKFSPINWRECK